MKKIFILICIAVSAVSCVRDGNELDRCPLTVTCRDMWASQSSDILNLWSGYCSEQAEVDLEYLLDVDGGEGKVLPEMAGYEFVYLDPPSSRVEGPMNITAWYKPVINALRVNFKNLASGNDIYPAMLLSDIPSGTIINEDFLRENDCLPEVDNFVMEYFEVSSVPGSGEGIINVWYNPVFTLTVRYTYGNVDIQEPAIMEGIKRGSKITIADIVAAGLKPDRIYYQNGWLSYYYSTPAVIVMESNAEMILLYQRPPE